MANCVYAAMYGVKPASLEPALDRARSDAQFEELASGDHAVLETRDSSDPRVPVCTNGLFSPYAEVK
jgi:hypothetical protein